VAAHLHAAAAEGSGGGGGEGGDRAALLRLAGRLAGVVAEELLQPRPLAHEVLIFPSDEGRQKLCSWIGSATTTLECCVFVISDARVAAELKEAAARGVAVRLITDDKTALDGGSQVFGMASAGVETLVDTDYELKSGAAPVPRHMHHKFAIVDGRVLLCGSYNWSYSASARNNENCVVTEDVYPLPTRYPNQSPTHTVPEPIP